MDVSTRPPNYGNNSGWSLWPVMPPYYKVNGLVEIWRSEMGNETGFLKLADVNMAMNVHGLWWRWA